MKGLDSLKEKYKDLPEEDYRGMYSYLYILKKKSTVISQTQEYTKRVINNPQTRNT